MAGAAVSWSMKGTINQSVFFVIHSQVVCMVQKPCVGGMYRGEAGDRNKIIGDCAKWGALNFLFAKVDTPESPFQG